MAPEPRPSPPSTPPATPPSGTGSRETLKTHLQEALELSLSEQKAYIGRVAASDAGLAAELQKLLGAHERAGNFMAEPTRAGSTPTTAHEADERAWDEVGAYVLQDRLGEGGFAVVWRARQEHPVRREVALKILKAGMDSRQVLARFAAERQTLAMLAHPSIARVLDAGTTPRGRPYFAMELVPGTPITEYCDALRLSVPDRLRLFGLVCQAVEHAHQKGVIHRDLKPSNILVTTLQGKPLPVVIDFGIAKLMEDPGAGTGGSVVTEARQIVGTPQYMSPEQAGHNGGVVDTRTDVYSLGVVLYELLAGVSPYDTAKLRRVGYAEQARVVREAKLVRPSSRCGTLGDDAEQIAVKRRTDPQSLSRSLKGDLDWIVLRALQRDADGRYPTASSLAQDIENHLRHRPVSAGPPSTLYLATKFVRRHRVGVTAGVVVAFAMTFGLAMALRGLEEANRMREVAEKALEGETSRLWESSLMQARASRRGNTPGRRAMALEAIRKAAEIRPALALRNEAVAALAIDDVDFRPCAQGAREAAAWGLRGSGVFLRLGAKGTCVGRAGDNADLVVGPDVPDGRTVGCAFSPDGTLAASIMRVGKGGRIELWNLPARAMEREWADGAGSFADAYFGGTEWIAIAHTSSQSVVVHPRNRDGEPLLDVPVMGMGVHLFATPNADLLAIADEAGKAVSVWSVRTKERVCVQTFSAAPVSVALNDAGTMLAVGLGDRRIALVRIANGEVLRTLSGHQGLPVRLGFARGSSVLVSASWDNTIRFWSVDSGAPALGLIEGWFPVSIGDEFLATSGEDAGVWTISPSRVYDRFTLAEDFGVNSNGEFLDEGRLYVTAGNNGVHVWRTDPGEHLMTLSGLESNSVAVFPERRSVVASTSEGVLEWSFDPSESEPTLAVARTILPPAWRGRTWVSRIPPSAGVGPRLAVLYPDMVQIITMDTGEVSRKLVSESWIAERPDVTPDGRLAFAGSWRSTAGYVWDMQTGEKLRSFEGTHVVGRFTPDGSSLIVGTPAGFTCYEVATWRVRWTARREWSDPLAGVITCAPDGSFVVVGQTRSRMRLLDTRTGRELATLQGPDMHELNDVCIAPDGRTIMCTTVDREVQRWRLDALRDRLRSIHPRLDVTFDVPQDISTRAD